MRFDIVKLCAVIGKVIISRSGKKASQKHADSIESYFKEQNTPPSIRRASLIYALIKTGETLSENERENGIDACIDEVAEAVFKGNEVGGFEYTELMNKEKVEDLPMFG